MRVLTVLRGETDIQLQQVRVGCSISRYEISIVDILTLFKKYQYVDGETDMHFDSKGNGIHIGQHDI